MITLHIERSEMPDEPDHRSREWWVFSAEIPSKRLMLACAKTGAYGVIECPTQKEWVKAFLAVHPYPWLGLEDRVVILREGGVQ